MKLGATHTNLKELIVLKNRHSAHTSARTGALQFLQGLHLGRRRGCGLDFNEVRPYVAGDDVRRIDWRVTARTGSPYAKLFHEETARTTLLIIDQRTFLHFGSTRVYKSVLGAEVAATLAWFARQNHDKVGGMVFNQQGFTFLKPRASEKNVLRFLQILHEKNHQRQEQGADEAQVFFQALEKLKNFAKRGSVVYLVGDFFDCEDKVFHLLSQLCKKCALKVIHLEDPFDFELPPPNCYKIISKGKQWMLDCSSKQSRQNYVTHAARRRYVLKRQLERLGVPLLCVQTKISAHTQLSQYFTQQPL